VLEEGKRQGCMTLAITNAPESPLAARADFVLELEAGPEVAVAATKTYTAELMAIACSQPPSIEAVTWSGTFWKGVPGWLLEVLGQDRMIAEQRSAFETCFDACAGPGLQLFHGL